ncbi:predicted protein [Postia placenta Mad-698-R]|nr:predicted protein [Postia placenta Mad-698-R]
MVAALSAKLTSLVVVKIIDKFCPLGLVSSIERSGRKRGNVEMIGTDTMVLRWTKRDSAVIRKAVKHESNVKNEESQNTIPIAQPSPRMSRTNFATILDHQWSIDLATQTITVATDDVHMHDDDRDYIELAAELSAVTLDGATITPHCDTPDSSTPGSERPDTPMEWTTLWDASCVSPEFGKESVAHIGSPHDFYVSGQRREPMGSGSDSVIKGLARTGCQRRAMMNTTTTAEATRSLFSAMRTYGDTIYAPLRLRQARASE